MTLGDFAPAVFGCGFVLIWNYPAIREVSLGDIRRTLPRTAVLTAATVALYFLLRDHLPFRLDAGPIVMGIAAGITSGLISTSAKKPTT
jgi:hypothetical protein